MATKNLPSAEVLTTWTVNDVQDWLKLNGYNEFVLPFRGHKFDGKKLLMLSEQALSGMNHEFPEKKQKSMIKQVEKVRGRKAYLKKLGSFTKQKQEAPAPVSRDYQEEDDDCGWGSDFDDEKEEEEEEEEEFDEIEDDDQPDYDLPPDFEDQSLPEYVAPTDSTDLIEEEYYEDPADCQSTDLIEEEYYEDPADSPPNMPRLPPRVPVGHFNQPNFNARPPAIPGRPAQAAVPPARQPKTNYPKTVPLKTPPLPTIPARPEPAAPPRPAKPSHMMARAQPPPMPQESDEMYVVPAEQETYEVPTEQDQRFGQLIQEDVYEIPNEEGGDDVDDDGDSDYEEPLEPEEEQQSPKTPGNRPPMPLPTSRVWPSPSQQFPQPAQREVGRLPAWQREKASASQPPWLQNAKQSTPPLPGKPAVQKPALPTPAETKQPWKSAQANGTTAKPAIPSWKRTTDNTSPQVPSWKKPQTTETDSSSVKNISQQRSPVAQKKWEPPGKRVEDTNNRSGGVADLRKMFGGATQVMGSKPPVTTPKPEFTVRDTGSPSGSGDGQFLKPPSLPERPDQLKSPGNSADGIASRPPLPFPDSSKPPLLPPGRPNKHGSPGNSADGIASRPPPLPPGRPDKHGSPGNSADGIASRPPLPFPDSSKPSQLPPARPPKPDDSNNSSQPSTLERHLPPRPGQDVGSSPDLPIPARPPKPGQQSTPPARPPPQQSIPPPRPSQQSTPKHKELPQIPTALPSSKNEFEGFPYYHGPLDRAKAESALKDTAKDGAFLVRDGRGGINSNDPYTISVWYNRKPWNLKICKRPNGKFALGAVKPGETTFNTALELVEFHRTTSLVLAGDAGRICLMIPAPVYD